MSESKRSVSISIARKANSRDIERRVRIAIDELALQGKVLSFYAIADAAHVARSTLYRKADLKELVAKARSAQVEPSTMAEELESLRRETAALHGELKRMRRKRDELALRLSRGSDRGSGPCVLYWVCRLDASA